MRSHSIRNPIKINSPHFSGTLDTIQHQGKKIEMLQNNVAIFGQLYVSVQNRDGDLAECFAHDIPSFPPSLSNFGKLHLPSTKSDLLGYLDQPGQPEPHLAHNCKVLEGCVIVHCLPTSDSTFHEHADAIFIPYPGKQLQSVSRLDVA